MTNFDESLIRHTPSSRIDTFRGDDSSDREAPMTPTALSTIGRIQPSDSGTDDGVRGQYRAPMTTTVSAVITAINFRRPGLKPPKIASLLYFAQGHHLGWSGEPLFSEPLVATDRGVTVETPAGSQSEPISREALLNSIGYTIDRYSALSPADLRTLIQASQPWQNARKPDAGPHIDLGDLREWFLRPDETDDPDDERPNRAERAEAEAYLASRGRP